MTVKEYEEMLKQKGLVFPPLEGESLRRYEELTSGFHAGFIKAKPAQSKQGEDHDESRIPKKQNDTENGGGLP
jgi:hypothetical protein